MNERAHERRSLPALESFLKDIVQGLRIMRTNPRFALAAIAILGLSIGVNTTVVTLTNAALFKGYPQVQRNDRLLYLTMYPDCCVSYPTFEDWRAMATSFQGMAAVHDSRRTFSDGDDYNSAQSYYATEITSDTFRLVERQPLLGRDFTHANELPGAAPVVILSYRLWNERYNRNPAVLGRTVRLNGLTTTIIGVMPRGFSFPQNQDLWVPLVPTSILRDRSHVGDIWYVLGRLADGVTADRARAEMQTIGQRLHASYPRTDSVLPLVRTFSEFFIRAESIRIYQAMLGAVTFLLLIACANVANLLLARSIDRSRELSVRLALGAGRWRIIRQLLVESVLLSAPGGVLGWVIARYGIAVYANFADGAGLSSWTGVWFANILDYSMDSRVFVYLVIISLGTGLLFGLVPALKLSELDIHHMLKDGGRGATGGERGKRLSTLLVMAETALTVVLLAGSGVMIRSLLKVYTANLGFDPSRELMMTLLLPRSDTGPEMISFANRLKARLEDVAGVESVAIASTRPYLPFRNLAYETSDAISARSDEGERPRQKTSWTITTPDHFRSLGLSMVAGRDFNDADGRGGNPVVIVNRQFASAVWPNQNAIGKRLRFFEQNAAGPWLTIIGIAPDIAQGDLAHRLYQFLPEVYVPYSQRPSNVLSIQALTRVPPAALANAFYRELRTLDPTLPLAIAPQSMAENLGQSRRYQDLISLLFLIFAIVALLLASVGLYSVIAHSVSRRTQEIGVRIALGATGAQILTLILRQAVIPVGVGLAAGLAVSLTVNPGTSEKLAGQIDSSTTIDVTFSNGGFTGPGGHPAELEKRNIERGIWTKADGEGAFYYVVDNQAELDRKWPQHLATRPDFIKTYLLYSEEYQARKNDPAFFGWTGLDPSLLKEVVAKSHKAGLRVSTHIETAADFHNAMTAGVDEINHMPGFHMHDDVRPHPVSAFEVSEADAREAARRGTYVVTTLAGTRSRDAEQDALNVRNLRVLHAAGVRLALGSDSYRVDSVPEALYIASLHALDNLTLLKVWTEATAQTIFPKRRIGRLREGYEANFIVLEGDPLQDFSNITRIWLLVKRGGELSILRAKKK